MKAWPHGPDRGAAAAPAPIGGRDAAGPVSWSGPAAMHDPLVPDVMRLVAMGLADGQLGQADHWLSVVDGRARPPRGWNGPQSVCPLVRALEHMRSATGWLVAAAEQSGAR
jgi:hypothetical protein